MTDSLDGRIGEAWAGDAPNGGHVNLVLARRGSATAAAAVGALAAPSPGHTPSLVCLGPGTVVHPLTIFVNKTTIGSDAIDMGFEALRSGAALRTVLDLEEA